MLYHLIILLKLFFISTLLFKCLSILLFNMDYNINVIIRMIQKIVHILMNKILLVILKDL